MGSWYCYRESKKSGPYLDEQMIGFLNNQQLSDNDDFINIDNSLDVLCLDDVKAYFLGSKVPDGVPADNQTQIPQNTITGNQTQAPQHPPIANQRQAPQNTPIGNQFRNAYIQQDNTGMKAQKRCANCNKKFAGSEDHCMICGTSRYSITNRNQFKEKNKKIPLIIAAVIIAPLIIAAALYMVKITASQIKIISVDDTMQESITAVQPSVNQEGISGNMQTPDNQKSTTARKQNPMSVGLGYYEGSIYHNNDLGLKYTIPQDFVIASAEEIAAIEMGAGFYGAFRVFAARHEVDVSELSNSNDNDNTTMGIEKMPFSNPPSSKGYIDATKQMFIDLNVGYSFNETSTRSINGVEFAVMNAKTRGLMQDFYVTTRYGYYVIFTNTYNSNEDKTLFNSMISSIEFN
jgi:hypothetical protein